MPLGRELEAEWLRAVRGSNGQKPEAMYEKSATTDEWRRTTDNGRETTDN